jgi:hypothetical protein
MNQDVESTHHEQPARSELDPLIQRDEKGPTKKESRMARAQFLALCWALFVIGWTDGSTGPLLPRIQKFYDVSWRFSFFDLFSTSHEFCRLGSELCLGYLCCNARSVIIIMSW